MGGVFAAIGRFFTELLRTITDAVVWISDAGVQVFVDLWEFGTDVPVWIFSQVLGVAETAIAALDVSGLAGFSGAWGSLPAEVLNVLGLIGLEQALGIITAAALIRLTMQVIPFVRLGS